MDFVTHINENNALGACITASQICHALRSGARIIITNGPNPELMRAYTAIRREARRVLTTEKGLPLNFAGCVYYAREVSERFLHWAFGGEDVKAVVNPFFVGPSQPIPETEGREKPLTPFGSNTACFPGDVLRSVDGSRPRGVVESKNLRQSSVACALTRGETWSLRSRHVLSRMAILSR
jgi:hypothetical protein